MEQLYQSIMFQPTLSRRYKMFVHYLINAHASFKVAHELIPYFVEFEGIDFFFRNKIEDSYATAITHLESAQNVLSTIRDGSVSNGAAGGDYVRDNLFNLQEAIRAVIADTESVLKNFYPSLGSDIQLATISKIRGDFSRIMYKSLELTSEIK